MNLAAKLLFVQVGDGCSGLAGGHQEIHPVHAAHFRRLTGGEPSKLKELDVVKIRQLANSGASQNEIARMFGIGQSHVSQIVRGKIWARRESA